MSRALHDDRALLVEGRTDKAVLVQLLAKHGLDPRIHERILHHCDGFEDLAELAYWSATATRRLGLVIDFDEPEDGRWASLRATFGSQGITLPEAPVPGGTTCRGAHDDFLVGVWVMPDNVSPGMLEHFLASLVPDDQRACWTYAREAASDARDRGARFSPRHRQKAEIHTWLAWQDPPGLPLGHALRQSILASDSDLARQFVDWYRTLFVEATPP